MGHDQLFKEVLQAYLRDFLYLFYPNLAEHFDFKTLSFPDKEFFTDFPAGSLRKPDIVARLETHEGNPEIVLIHVEIELKRKRDFEERMFQYYAMIWLRYRAPILPIVIYLKGGRDGLTAEEYRVKLFGREHLRFQYEVVRLASLDAKEYLGKRNPLAAALAALMERRETEEPLELRASMLKEVFGSKENKVRKFILLNLIETYFTLSAEEMESFDIVLSKKEFQEVKEMELTWADEMRMEGHQKGREEGRQAGLVAGKRETLLRQLTTKFGTLPEQIASRVQAIESPEQLDTCLDRVLTAKSLNEIGLGS